LTKNGFGYFSGDFFTNSSGHSVWYTLALAATSGIASACGVEGSNPARDRCYDFLNIFAENFSEKIGVFDSKQS
jgi:hypothetical protein